MPDPVESAGRGREASLRRAPPALRAVLFDWDGTLVNSAEASYRCYVRLFQGYGLRFDRDLFERSYSPDWTRTYLAVGLPAECWPEADRRWVEHYEDETTELLEGARESLARLHGAGLALGVVTSGDRRRVTRELTAFGVDRLFSALVCGQDCRQRKPHPEGLLQALESLGVTPSGAAYVGDSPEDVLMARAAGAYSIGIPGAFPNRRALAAAEPDLLAPDLDAAVETLLGRVTRGGGL